MEHNRGLYLYVYDSRLMSWCSARAVWLLQSLRGPQRLNIDYLILEEQNMLTSALEKGANPVYRALTCESSPLTGNVTHQSYI